MAIHVFILYQLFTENFGDFPSRRTFIASKFCELFKAPKIGAKKLKSINENQAFFTGVENLKPTKIKSRKIKHPARKNPK